MGLTIWLIITVILIVVEIITLGLTSIWFAGGAFVAGLISLTVKCRMRVPFVTQESLFVNENLIL